MRRLAILIAGIIGVPSTTTNTVRTVLLGGIDKKEMGIIHFLFGGLFTSKHHTVVYYTGIR